MKLSIKISRPGNIPDIRRIVYPEKVEHLLYKEYSDEPNLKAPKYIWTHTNPIDFFCIDKVIVGDESFLIVKVRISFPGRIRYCYFPLHQFYEYQI